MRRQLHGISSMWNHGLDCHRSCDPCSAHIHAGWCQVPLQQAMWGSDNNGWRIERSLHPWNCTDRAYTWHCWNWLATRHHSVQSWHRVSPIPSEYLLMSIHYSLSWNILLQSMETIPCFFFTPILYSPKIQSHIEKVYPQLTGIQSAFYSRLSDGLAFQFYWQALADGVQLLSEVKQMISEERSTQQSDFPKLEPGKPGIF